MKIRHFLAVLSARNKEFLRDRASLSWNVLFPFLLIVGLAFAFGGDKRDQFKVAVYAEPEQNQQRDYLNLDYVKYIPVESREAAIRKVGRHQFDLLLDFEAREYHFNDSSSNGYILDKLVGASNSIGFSRNIVGGENIRYVDWALPGVLGMNLMFSCLFGVGYVIVRYRKNSVLKRLNATPLSAFSFLSAQVASRLILSLGVTVVVFIGCQLLLNTTMNGSYVLLFVAFFLGALSLISLSLLMSTRTASEELAGGLLNLATWPMMMLSGVWFSLDGAHPILQKVALIFPLTHLVNAAREIMIDGAGLAEIYPSLLILLIASLVFLLLASVLFKWDRA